MTSFTPSEQKAYDARMQQLAIQNTYVEPTLQTLNEAVTWYLRNQELNSSPYYEGSRALERAKRSLQSETKQEKPVARVHKPVYATEPIAFGGSVTHKGRYNRQSQRRGLQILSKPYIGETVQRNGTPGVADLQAAGRRAPSSLELLYGPRSFTRDENEAFMKHRQEREKELYAVWETVTEYQQQLTQEEITPIEPEEPYTPNPIEGIKPTRLTRRHPKENKWEVGENEKHNRQRSQGKEKTSIPEQHGLITLTGDKPDTRSVAEITADILKRDYLSQFVLVYSAEPGKLERHDTGGMLIARDSPYLPDTDVVPEELYMTGEHSISYDEATSLIDSDHDSREPMQSELLATAKEKVRAKLSRLRKQSSNKKGRDEQVRELEVILATLESQPEFSALGSTSVQEGLVEQSLEGRLH